MASQLRRPTAFARKLRSGGGPGEDHDSQGRILAARRYTRRADQRRISSPKSLPKEIAGIYWAKSMYWRGKSAERFVRPVRWLVSLLDGEVVPLEFAGMRAGNATRRSPDSLARNGEAQPARRLFAELSPRHR